MYLYTNHSQQKDELGLYRLLSIRLAQRVHVPSSRLLATLHENKTAVMSPTSLLLVVSLVWLSSYAQQIYSKENEFRVNKTRL
jgi:predicted DNA-binding ribbon-helix-helix protein